jgi:hypothetical protein
MAVSFINLKLGKVAFVLKKKSFSATPVEVDGK